MSRGVGFLRYFQLKQLPNFLLASPILSLAFFSVVHYAKSRPQVFFSLGFDTTNEEKSSGVVFLSRDLSRFKAVGSVEKSSVRVEGIILKQIIMFPNWWMLGTTLMFEEWYITVKYILTVPMWWCYFLIIISQSLLCCLSCDSCMVISVHLLDILIWHELWSCEFGYITGHYLCNYNIIHSVSEHFNVRRRKDPIKGDVSNVRIESESSANLGYLSASVLPFVLHLGFLAGTAFLVMHVQVGYCLADFCFCLSCYWIWETDQFELELLLIILLWNNPENGLDILIWHEGVLCML